LPLKESPSPVCCKFNTFNTFNIFDNIFDSRHPSSRRHAATILSSTAVRMSEGDLLPVQQEDAMMDSSGNTMSPESIGKRLRKKNREAARYR